MNQTLQQSQRMTWRLRGLLWAVLLAILLGWTVGGPIAVVCASAPSEVGTPARYERRITRENLRHLTVAPQPLRVKPRHFDQAEPRHIPVSLYRTVRR